MKLLTSSVFVLSLCACSHSRPAETDRQSRSLVPSDSLTQVAEKKTIGAVDDNLPQARPKAQGPECLTLDAGITLPYYEPESQLILIGFVRTCTREDGTSGFVRGSSWTAMGFPCTLGKGRIEKKGGTENNPSLLRFSMPNACPMNPQTPQEVETALRRHLNIPKDSKLVAYYPLSVDFWEFEQYPESDTGFAPEIYSPNALSKGWAKFISHGEPLKVKLYGRENAWERGRFLFQVEADIVPEGRHQFKLKVRKAEALSEDAMQKVKGRCEALRPSRECLKWLP